MADNPDGQSCANCSFYITEECRASRPSVSIAPGLFARPEPGSWCVEWNVWPGKPPPAAVGAVCTSGTAAPSGGADGDFYVLHSVPSVPFGIDFIVITTLAVYQKQSGAWVVIETVL